MIYTHNLYWKKIVGGIWNNLLFRWATDTPYYLIFIGVEQIGRSVWTPRLEESNFQQVNRLGVQFARVEKKLSGLNSALVFYTNLSFPTPIPNLTPPLLAERLPAVILTLASIYLNYRWVARFNVKFHWYE